MSERIVFNPLQAKFDMAGITQAQADARYQPLDADLTTIAANGVTGTGPAVLQTSPTMVTPILGTPSSVTLTNATGLPLATGISGFGTGIATALATNTGSAGAPVLFNGAGGTPTSLTLTNATGLPISTGVSGLGAGVATFLATPSSANLASAVTDETGTAGALVFSASPTFTGTTNADISLLGLTGVGQLTFAGSTTPPFQVASTATNVGLARFSNNTSAAKLIFAKSRSGTIGTFSAVTTGDRLGSIEFQGADSTNALIVSSEIRGGSEGTIGSGVVPGTISLITQTSGGSMQQGLLVDSAQNVFIGNGSAKSTSATDGFLFLSAMAGTPTGSVTLSSAGKAAVVWDTTGKRFWINTSGSTSWEDQTGTGTKADALGFRGLPQNSQSGNYTCVAADSGKHVIHPSGAGAGDTITIPANSSVAFDVGTFITFVNMDSNAVSIAITTDTMNLAGAGTTGTRTLAQYGIATAVKVASTTWLIYGTNLT